MSDLNEQKLANFLRGGLSFTGNPGLNISNECYIVIAQDIALLICAFNTSSDISR
jgi:hypothetical protein